MVGIWAQSVSKLRSVVWALKSWPQKPNHRSKGCLVSYRNGTEGVHPWSGTVLIRDVTDSPPQSSINSFSSFSFSSSSTIITSASFFSGSQKELWGQVDNLLAFPLVISEMQGHTRPPPKPLSSFHCMAHPTVTSYTQCLCQEICLGRH